MAKTSRLYYKLDCKINLNYTNINIVIKKILKSFSFAFEGILYAFKTQWNFRFHCFSAILVVFMSFFFKISTTEWLFVILCIGLVMFAELINTALETLVDLVSPEYHKLAKIAKDTAAASVLALAIMSLIIGFIIFFPYLKNFFLL